MFHLTFRWMQQTSRGPTGWTENFWLFSSTLEAALINAAATFPLIAAVHSEQALCLGYSVRSVGDDPGVKEPRLTTSVNVNDGPLFRSTREPGMYPTTALRISIYDVDGRSNDVWLKGMPDGIDIGGVYTPIPAWLTHLNGLLAWLQNPVGQFARRALDTTQPYRFLSSITATGVVTTQVAHGYGNGNFVRVGRTFSDPNIDGIYRITVGADPAVFTLTNFPPVDGPPVITNTSYAQRQLYNGLAVVSAVAETITKKNTGRLTGGPRGRQTTPKN